MKKNFAQKIILYVCIIGCITHPIKSMDNYSQLTRKTVIMTGATILCGYLLYKIAQFIGLKYYISLDSKSKKIALAPTDPIEIPFLNFSDWFEKTNAICQRDYSEILNNKTFCVKDKGPFFKHYKIACEKIQKITQMPFNTIKEIIEGYTQLCISSGLLKNEAWVNNETPFTENFFTRKVESKHGFSPFVEGIKIPVGSNLYFFGDRHGDVRSTMHLLRELQNQDIMDNNDGFKIKSKNTYLIFLGDYVDRGLAGIEVIITILMLKLKNPNNVFLIRGNHENKDLDMNMLFQKEVEYKYSDEFARIPYTNQDGITEFYGLTDESKKNLNLITKIYTFMPVALFIGSENNLKTYYILASHANVDMRYNPWDLYEELSKRQINDLVYESYSKENQRDCFLHYGEVAKISWKKEDRERRFFTQPAKSFHNVDFSHKYTSDNKTPYEMKYDKDDQDDDRFDYGKDLVDAILKDWSNIGHTSSWIQRCLGIEHTSHTKCVIRGHQHFYNEEAIKNCSLMQALKEQKGITASWEEDRDDDYSSLSKKTMLTMQQAPENSFIPKSYNLTYDTCAQITTGKNNDWALKVINVDVLKK